MKGKKKVTWVGYYSKCFI